MRADAQRNRARILTAARELVAEVGVDATMEDIARSADVAVGTLYRHFPAKEDLVRAVVDDSIAHMTTLTEQALAAVDAGADPGERLGALFVAISERYATDRAFKAAAGGLEHPHAEDLTAVEPDSPTARAIAAITALLDRARDADAVRRDVTLADLVMLLAATPGAEAPPPMRRRYAEIVLAGLHPLPPGDAPYARTL